MKRPAKEVDALLLRSFTLTVAAISLSVLASASSLTPASATVATTCPVTPPTLKVKPGAGFSAAEFNFGNRFLRAQLWPQGRLVAGRLPGGGLMATLRPDGSIDAKQGWWRGVPGKLEVRGQRLDAAAHQLRSWVPGGYGSTGFQPVGLTFPTAGCWKVVGKIGSRTSLTFVVNVSKVTSSGMGAQATGLDRPIHFPFVAPDARCPVSPSPLAAPLRRRLNGSRPVFLMSVGTAGAGTIQVHQSAPDSLGWLGQKTPWFVERGYSGPLVIRGGRLDEPEEVRFAKGYGQHLGELRFRAGENNGIVGAFRFLASTSLFRTTGCYAFQIDGTSFSKVIVMRVVNDTHL